MGVAVNRAMISVEDALARVLAPLDIVPAEQIPVAEALGRVLAEDLAARVRHPPTAISMDGYAVRSNDLRWFRRRSFALAKSRRKTFEVPLVPAKPCAFLRAASCRTERTPCLSRKTPGFPAIW